MSTALRLSHPARRARKQDPEDRVAEPTNPVKVWAGLGAVLVTFELYLLAKWVSGPYFETVPSGPSVPPAWMKVAINTAQVLMPLLMLLFFYVLLVRPWWRSRQLTSDGLMCVGLLVVSVYDPVSNYLQNWLTYNSYFVNFGSVVKGIPGWLAPAEPGAMAALPILFVPPAYVVALFGAAMLGCQVMGRLRSHWPAMSAMKLMMLCFGFFLVFDVVLEGFFFMRLGFYMETGFSINAGRYYQLPVSNILLVSVLFTAVASIRFFKNDRGQTLFERGAERVVNPGRRNLLRLVAIVGGMQATLFLTYHIPQTLWQGAHAGPWPASVQSRSYLTNHLCGPGTDRACPGPTVPAAGPEAPYLDTSGKLVVPPGTKLPTPSRFTGLPDK